MAPCFVFLFRVLLRVTFAVAVVAAFGVVVVAVVVVVAAAAVADVVFRVRR